SLIVDALDNGDGGTIEIQSHGDLTIESARLSAEAGSNGNGGAVSLTAVESILNLQGNISVNGGTSGRNGGIIHLEGGQIMRPAELNPLLTANGVEGGNGGTIEVITQLASVNFGTGNGEINIEAKAGEITTL